MNGVGVKFLLKYGHYFLTVLEADKARDLIIQFCKGTLGKVITNVDYPNHRMVASDWGVNRDDIQCIHTFDPRELQVDVPPVLSGLPHTFVASGQRWYSAS